MARTHVRPRSLAAAMFMAAAFMLLALPLPTRSWSDAPAPPPADAPAPPLLVIFHTNDVHGYALEEKNSAGQLTHLGYARLKAYYDRVPARHKLLMDAGDVLHSQPFATARRGEFVARLLEPLHYDALAVGNHDFDYGQARLMELRDTYRLPFIASNIVGREDGVPLLPPFLVKDFGDIKVGVFALTTPETPVKTSPGNVAAVTFGTPDDLAARAREQVRHLREKEKVDLVVAVTHLGTDALDEPNSQTIARQAPGIDLLIDGHSHSRVAGLKVGDTLIVSTGAYLENLGQVTVTRSAKGKPLLAPKLVPAAEFASISPDPAVAALSATLSAELDQELSRVVAHTDVLLDGDREGVRFHSTNLGRIIGAALRSATGADVALINGGSIRASIPAGDVTRGQMLAVLPYGNYALSVEMTGAELLAVLQEGLNQPGQGAYLQYHGPKITAVESKEYGADGTLTRRLAIRSVDLGGRPLDPAATYTVAINEFMYSGGDGYTQFARYPAREYATLEEIFSRFLMESGRDTLEALTEENVLTVAGGK